MLASHDVGICIDSSDITEFSKAMEKLAHDPKRRMTMGHRGRELFVERFNWERQEDLLLNLYQE